MRVQTKFGPGELITDNAPSSYGFPVVVVDGVAYGPAEAGDIHTRPLGPEDAEDAALADAARKAGYEVHC